MAAFAAAGALALGWMAGPALAQQPAAATKPAAAKPEKKLNPSVVLTWSGKQQVDAYKDMEKYFAVKTVKKGTNVFPLPAGTPIAPQIKFSPTHAR